MTHFLTHSDFEGFMPTRNEAKFWIGDRYCGLVKLGAGGMGEVWAGKSLGDRGFEQIVAIKRLHIDRRRVERDHRALLDEAIILQHLSASPNIVTVIDLREQDGQPALILEYIDGPELRDVLKYLGIKGERLPFPILAYILTEVSKGLSYAHHCRHPKTAEPLGIIHRDVSPSNIMISSTGAVKLTDFGIAKSQLQTVETQVGEIKGKFAYMAPEQARGKKLDFKADYFSLGLVLYECFYGRPAYRAETDAAFIDQARSAKIEYPSPAKGLESIFKRLLVFDPSKRYADLDEFRRDLASAAIQLGGMATSEDLKNYLKELNPPQLSAAIELRKNLELALPFADRDGQQTAATDGGTRRWSIRRWITVAAGGIGVALISFLAVGLWQHRPERQTVAAPVVASPAQPPPVPHLVTQEDHAVQEPPMVKKPLVATIRFTSKPPSTVSIPGRIKGQDAPSPPLSIPAGNYRVVFTNPLASGPVSTSLNITDGGRYRCHADMQVDPVSGSPTGQSPTASCHKE